VDGSDIYYNFRLKYPDGDYKEFLNEIMPEYNKPRYEVYQNQILLIMAFGNEGFKTEPFQQLLSCNYDDLCNCITEIFREMGKRLKLESWKQRSYLMKCVHKMLVQPAAKANSLEDRMAMIESDISKINEWRKKLFNK